MYCERTGVWWAVYVEGEGMYCLLCRKHLSKAVRNKSDIFSVHPSTRFKWGTLDSHRKSDKHISSISNELLSRTSMFQRELDDREKTKFDVLEKVFTSIYWLAKENVANTKTVSHLQLLEQLGLAELHHVQHRSPVSLREIYLTIGETIQMQMCDEVPNELYGLLVDDVADISNSEQMVIFIQYYSAKANNLQVKLLCVVNVLENYDSANAATMHSVIKKHMERKQIPLSNLSGLALMVPM